MSYIGHGMSHAIFGGAVASYIVNLNFYLGATTWGFVSAIIINEISKRNKIKADAAIGIVTTAGFAIGVLLISLKRTYIKNFEALLFGNILGITDQDLIVIVLVTVITGVFVFIFQKRLLFTVFDRETAQVYGVRTEIIDILFSLVLACVVIASMTSIGVTLLASAIVAPAICARILTNNFLKMIVISCTIGITTAFTGMYASFYFNSASGATIVLFGAAAFGITYAYSFIHKMYHSHYHGDLKHAHRHTHTETHQHEH
jgi:manganese/iron transport system permease protein/iron/zinc/copper transport system permease protein